MTALIASITQQERALVFDRFDEASAWRLGNLLRGWGEAGAMPLLVEIGFFHRRLFFTALPGSLPDNEDWVRRKRNVVQRFGCASYRLGRELEARGDTLAGRYGLPASEYAAHGGAFPITVRGTGMVGAVVASGLPQREDHLLVVRALCEVLGHDVATLPLAG